MTSLSHFETKSEIDCKKPGFSGYINFPAITNNRRWSPLVTSFLKKSRHVANRFKVCSIDILGST